MIGVHKPHGADVKILDKGPNCSIGVQQVLARAFFVESLVDDGGIGSHGLVITIFDIDEQILLSRVGIDISQERLS